MGPLWSKPCAEAGTHYLDVTGEIPWTYDMMKRYHETAKRNGSIVISQDGMESAPSDLLCWLLVSHIRESLGVGTKEAIPHDMGYQLSSKWWYTGYYHDSFRFLHA